MSIGSDDGIATGEVLHLFRKGPNPRYLGKVRVVSVECESAVGQIVARGRGLSSLVHAASFSPDGSRIVTGSFDGLAKVWDARTGVEVLTLKGHANWVTSASFSPDGSRVVTAGKDNTAKVWDATPLKEDAPALADRLPAILEGEDQPAGNAERLAFAEIAHDGQKFAPVGQGQGEPPPEDAANVRVPLTMAHN